MSGVFGSVKPKNNEEYRILLKKRQKRMICVAVTGLLTVALSVGLDIWNADFLNDYASGFLKGVGAGLIVGAMLCFLNLRSVLRNEETLKQSRLRETDEREQQISACAMRTAAGILIVVLYILMVAGSIFSPEMTRLCLVLAAIFFGSYSLLKIYYQKRM